MPPQLCAALDVAPRARCCGPEREEVEHSRYAAGATCSVAAMNKQLMALVVSFAAVIPDAAAAAPIDVHLPLTWVVPAIPTISIVGQYEVQTETGGPVAPGAVVTSVIVPLPGFPNVYVGAFYIDHNQGQGPQPIPGEGTVIVPAGAGSYVWENSRGTTGSLEQDDLDYDSEVLTGPIQGLKRRLYRI